MSAAAPELTPGAPHVRDATNLRRVMGTVLVAVAPCLLFGLYNTGWQANRAIAELGLEPAAGWRGSLLGALGAGHDPSSVTDCVLVGLLRLAPLLAVVLAAGAAWEGLFAAVRRRVPAPGLAVTAVLFTACLPPTLPAWQAALGMSVAIVVGREVFGGTGRNVFNPAVVGLAFLTLAWPGAMRGEGVWIAAEGAKSPALLEVATAGGAEALAASGTTWLDAFAGRIPGALGETSALACLLGAVWLVLRRVASWRVVLGVAIGAAATGALMPGPSAVWHLVLGNLAFAAVFLATDPVTSPATDAGRWVYGLLVGFLVVLVRVANPVQTEGVVFAILLGNVAAPSIDRAVVRLHVAKRRRRLARA